MTCPNSTGSGCRCPEHDPGLAAYARDLPSYAAALASCQPKPRIVAWKAPEPEPVVYFPSIVKQIRQPWEPRPARRAA